MVLALRGPRGDGLRVVKPRVAPDVTLYVCGPTVYDAAHVGHARTYLVFDLARRQLEADGLAVRHVMNITDYEDKITDRARSLRMGWEKLARSVERGFETDLRRLGILPPERTPRASEHVAAMRAAIRHLEKRGLTVRREGGLYFRPPGPWRSGYSVGSPFRQRLVAEPGRVGPSEAELEGFALWLPPHGRGPAWESPWGRGTPGWHVECYVMASRYLGLPVDLHGGGRDLEYPHHAAERMLARALDRLPFARQYLYSEFVTQGGGKMSKSTGNLVPLRATIEEHGAPALRFYLLGQRYSEPLAWDPKGLERAGAEFTRIRRALWKALPDGGGGKVPVEELGALVAGIDADIRNDLDAPAAFARLSKFVDRLGSTPRARFPRGTRTVARALLYEIEQRTGLPLGGALPIRARRRGARASIED